MLSLKYDLRGILNKDLTPEVIDYVIEKFFKRLKRKKPILLATDFNLRNLAIKDYLLQKYPAIFEDLQALPSPVVYWYVQKTKKPAIMLTASHLPQNYVGLKFVLEDGTNWKPNHLPNFFPKTKFSFKKTNIIVNTKILKDYFLFLKTKTNLQKQIKLTFETKNIFLKSSLPYFRYLNLYHSLKSPFKIKADGDNDRIFIFYQKKQILPDFIFYLLALKSPSYRKLGVPIYFCKELEKKLLESKKQIFYLPTGHIYFKKAFKKYKLDLAFEPSGHFYLFRDLKTEGPYLMLAKFFEVWQENDLEILKSLKIKRFSLKLDNGLKIENLASHLKRKFNLKLKKFDGFWLFDHQRNNFVHLRSSATENKLRVSVEGPLSQFLIKEIKTWLQRK